MSNCLTFTGTYSLVLTDRSPVYYRDLSISDCLTFTGTYSLVLTDRSPVCCLKAPVFRHWHVFYYMYVMILKLIGMFNQNCIYKLYILYSLYSNKSLLCVLNVKLDSAVTVRCRTAIKALLLYFNLQLSVKLDSFSCSFTTISFLT